MGASSAIRSRNKSRARAHGALLRGIANDLPSSNPQLPTTNRYNFPKAP